MGRTKRNLPRFIVGLVVVPAACIRLYFELVPRGAPLEPFLGYSFELPAITSPRGKSYRVFINDAGAAHSGNHWTWIVDHHWLTGRYVVAEGYLTSEYANQSSALVVQWNGDRPIIDFETGR